MPNRTKWSACLQIKVASALGIVFERRLGDALVGATLRAVLCFGRSARPAFDDVAVRWATIVLHGSTCCCQGAGRSLGCPIGSLSRLAAQHRAHRLQAGTLQLGLALSLQLDPTCCVTKCCVTP